MRVTFSEHFKRSLRGLLRKNPELRGTFWDKVKVFEESPFHPSLKMHTLGGKLRGLRAFWLTRELRVVFEFTPTGDALFTDIGDHHQVY